MAKTFSLSVLLKVIDDATRPLRKIGENFRGMSRKIIGSLKAVGQRMQTIGTNITDFGKKMSMMTLPIAAFGAKMIHTATNFQAAMNMVGAVTRATGKEFEEMEELAKEMGATTQFSASQAADAMKFMGMSGMNVEEIMSALPKVLQLAAAAQLDMGSAADIVTNVMRGYGKEVEELTEVNDVLVNAFTGANVDLRMLGESFKYAGPIAKGAGLDFEVTAALIAKMGDAGIQGSMAGTAMRGMLLRLQNPTKKASDLLHELGIEMAKSGTKAEKEGAKGVFDLIDVVKQMEEKGATAAQIAKIVGDRAGPGLAVLVQQGTVSLEKFIKMLKESGRAARVAEGQMKGLPGAFKLLASSFEAVQLAIMDTEFGKGVEELVRYLADLLRHLAKVKPETLAIGAAFGTFLVALGPVLIGLGLLIKSLGTIMIAIAAVKAAVAVFATVFVPLIAAIGAVTAAVGLMIIAFNMVRKNWDMIKLGLWELKEMFLEAFLNPIDLIKENWSYIIPWFGSLWDTLKLGVSEFGQFIKEMIVSPIKTIRTMFPGFLKFGKGKEGEETGGELKGKEGEETGGELKGTRGAIGARPGQTKSQADVNIRLVADPGTEATVQQVKKKKGDVNVNLSTMGYVGATM
jgi:TP901 family phage tail tape measure protein